MLFQKDEEVLCKLDFINDLILIEFTTDLLLAGYTPEEIKPVIEDVYNRQQNFKEEIMKELVRRRESN